MIELLFETIYDSTGLHDFQWYWRMTWAEKDGKVLYGVPQGPFTSRLKAIKAYKQYLPGVRLARDIRFEPEMMNV